MGRGAHAGRWLRTAALLALIVLPATGGRPAVAGAAQNPIAAENQNPGTSSWVIAGGADQTAIAAYTDEYSYLPGDTVTLFVDSGGDPFTYSVYRMGYYQGLGGRLMLDEQTPVANPVQPASTITSPGNLYLTNWRPSTSFATGSDWVSGFYLVKLTDTVSGAESYASFTLRSADPAPIVVSFTTNTWLSYNGFGGLSTYHGAQIVSQYRPWDQGGGAGQFFTFDLPLVEFLEQHGYPVSYATDDEADRGDLTGPQTRLVIETGHGEYHTLGERTNVWSLPTRGVSVAIFGGNSWNGQVRRDYDAHTLTNWRDSTADPLYGTVDQTAREEVLGYPQNLFTGEMQSWLTPLQAHPTAFAARAWPWRGAGVADGSPLPSTLGGYGEYDGIDTLDASPRNLILLSRQPLAGWTAGESSFWGVHPGGVASMSIRDLRNGAFVFNAGNLTFNWDLAAPLYDGAWPTWEVQQQRYPTTSLVSQAIQRLAGNLIAHATGIPNPIPAVAAPVSPLPALWIDAPHHFPVAVGGALVVEYTTPPPGTASISVMLDGHRVGAAQVLSSVWTGPLGLVTTAGEHRVTLIARNAAGLVLMRRSSRFGAEPMSAAVFRYFRGLRRGYANTRWSVAAVSRSR